MKAAGQAPGRRRGGANRYSSQKNPNRPSEATGIRKAAHRSIGQARLVISWSQSRIDRPAMISTNERMRARPTATVSPVAMSRVSHQGRSSSIPSTLVRTLMMVSTPRVPNQRARKAPSTMTIPSRSATMLEASLRAAPMNSATSTGAIKEMTRIVSESASSVFPKNDAAVSRATAPGTRAKMML